MKNKNEWFAAEAVTEKGERIVVRGRLFLQSLCASGKYPMRVEVIWHYAPDPHGMPNNEELFRLDEQMNRLTDAEEKDLLSVLTAVHIGAGQSRFVYYTGNLDRFSERLDATFSGLPLLPIQIGAEQDTNWKDYSDMLETYGLTSKTR